MQSLSIWHWIIIAILIVLVACAIWLFARAINNRRPNDRSVRSGTATPVSGPSGFQGWVLLLAIGVFVSPIYTIVTFVQTSDLQKATSGGEYRLMYAASTGLYLALFILQICTAFLMALRERRFAAFYIVTAIATILFKPVDILLVSAMASLIAEVPFGGILTAVVSNESADTIREWISTFVGLGIWMLYVIRSRRVANTFVR